MGAYLDHAATTPLRPEARRAIEAALDDGWGNPSGHHAAARAARRRLDDARDLVADCVGAGPDQIVFTSGGTEADNLAVRGVIGAAPGPAWCSAVEHPAVLEPMLATGGATLPVGADGVIDLDALGDRLAAAPGTTLVAVMAVNNELGTCQPIEAVAETVRRAAPGAHLHVDAVAAAPWFDLGPVVAAADLVALSGHKFGAPKGTGVLVVRGGTPLAPVLLGGGQERERRSGTQDVMGAEALAAALAATVADRAVLAPRIAALADRLAAGLLTALPGARRIGGPDVARSPGIVHLLIPDVEREALLFLLDEAGVAASAGSSCASGALERSHVLAACGVDDHAARGALRLSLGWSSTDADVDLALAAVPDAVARLGGAVAR